MFFRFLVLFLSLSQAIWAYNLKNFDIEPIAPSSGVAERIAKKISTLIGKKIEISSDNSEFQIFADEVKKFQKLDKSLRSRHKILWAVRGGYGMDKIMPFIVKSDYSKVSPKIIIGYSDLTPLMIYFSQKYGWIAINAPMLKDFCMDDKSKSSYKRIINFLKASQNSLKIADLQPINNFAKSDKVVIGKITGGNLTCIISTIGTTWQIDTNEKILFIEDTTVTGFRLDRLLSHIKNAGLLQNVKAIVFGDFGTDVTKILKQFASKMDIPVYKSSSFGHGKTNLPFVYNSTGIIKRNSNNAEIEMKS